MFLNILLSVLMLIALIIPGFILKKIKLVSAAAVPGMVAVLLYVNQPFLIIKAFLYDGSKGLDPRDGSFLLNLLFAFIISAAAQCLMFTAVRLCMKRTKPPERARAYTFASVFGNIGFIGIPFIAAVIPGNPAALIYCTVFNVTFNMLMWTVGVYIITGDIKAVKPLKILLNPPTLAVLAALPLFFFKVDFNLSELGRKAVTLIGYIGDMTTPLAMLIVGIRLADVKLKEIFTEGAAYACSALKLAAAPLIMFGLLMLVRLTGIFGSGGQYETYGKTLMMVLLTLSALPSAASTIAFSEKFGGDTQAALKGFMNSTLLSGVTMPVILTLLFSLL